MFSSKMYINGSKGKKGGSFLLNVVFFSNHQTINIYSRHRSFLMCFSNQNILINIAKCHNIAFYA